MGREIRRLQRQQRQFQRGQAMLRNGTWHHDRAYRAYLRRIRAGEDQDLTSGLMVVQKEAGADTIELWIGAVLLTDPPADSVRTVLTIVGEGTGHPVVNTEATLQWFAIGDNERDITGWAPGLRFFHAHLDVPGLSAGGPWYQVSTELPDFPEHEATCRARTLPGPLARSGPLTVFTASCYDVDTDRENGMHLGYGKLPRPPDLTWITGDAIYADAPWWLYATAARHTPRSYLLLEYWTAWGMQRVDDRERSGLRALLTKGPNWFLPDDHEFWDNWPHQTVTAKHSYGKVRWAVRNMVRRRFAKIANDATVVVPKDPGVSPTCPLAQNYFPVHPDEWEAWSRGAFDLFGSFQTPSVRDRAGRDGRGPRRITRGARDDDRCADPCRPPRGGADHTVHVPLNQLVQTIEIDPLQVVLLDTRTRRVRRRDHPFYSTFVDEDALNAMLDVAAAAKIFVLVLAQPILVPPASAVNQRIPGASRGMEHYPDQYARFWRGLVDARRGRPTITIGGDIHRSYLGLAESLSLIEIIASPMSPVEGASFLGLGHRLRDLLPGRLGGKDRYGLHESIIEVERLFPGGAGGRPQGAAISLGSLAQNKPGFATLTFSQEVAGIRLDVGLFDRDQLAAAEPAEECAPVVAKSFMLRTDGSDPSIVIV